MGRKVEDAFGAVGAMGIEGSLEVAPAAGNGSRRGRTGVDAGEVYIPCTKLNIVRRGGEVSPGRGSPQPLRPGQTALQRSAVPRQAQQQQMHLLRLTILLLRQHCCRCRYCCCRCFFALKPSMPPQYPALAVKPCGPPPPTAVDRSGQGCNIRGATEAGSCVRG